MDANKFMTEYQRMCTSYERCADCPLYADKPCAEMPSRYTKVFSDKLIKAVEEWSASHPVATRAHIFKKVYPSVSTYQDGTIKICPHDLDIGFECPGPLSCIQCKTKYWNKEVQQ